MPLSRAASSSRTMPSTCEISTCNSVAARFLTESFNLKPPQSDGFAGRNSGFTGSDLDLVGCVRNAGNVGQQQSSPDSTLILDDHSEDCWIQFIHLRLFRREKDID